ncbi:ATP-binding protein [Psychromonas sp. KJ10-10]|uniref:ATP-binding protein n=1 Tax=Psychromonas sp. KJ10-10 TaxID=3391823 RepID=UPI0039B4270B
MSPELQQNKLTINADPDFIVQCLDKLINNAMEFNLKNEPIEVTLRQQENEAVIGIHNKGPLLPNAMSEELLNSMVSVREHKQPIQNAEHTHLGLGLFIAKLICDFHQASIAITNNKEKNGVSVTLRFPLI